MFGMTNLIKMALFPKSYIWVEVFLIKETGKAILIEFDGSKAWFPKAWIAKIKRNRGNYDIKIKLSEYYWTKKFT